jgi:hypothetical protein
MTIIIGFNPYFPSFALPPINPVTHNCNAFTNAGSSAILSCALVVTAGDIVVAGVTCEGCSIAANPIMNDSQSNVYHLFDSNCCSATGAGQIGAYGITNISASATLTVSGQIQDTIARSFWQLFVADVQGTSHNITTYKAGYGSTSGGQSNINTASTSWTNTSVVIFESADANGFAPTCTSQFLIISNPAAQDNTGCYNYNYTTANSPSTFTMGSGGTTFAEQALIIPYTPSFPTVTITSTITGFLVPNFVNGISSLSWLYFLLVVMVPMGEIIGVITMDRNSILDRHAIIFVFLGLLLLDSIFGVMLNVVTVAMPFIFGILFGIYLWRGRG